MLNPFGSKAKLLKEVERLCIFNDKGWGGDTSSLEKIELERDARIERIQELISNVRRSSLPESFLKGIEDGSIREEIEGVYIQSLKKHFNGAAS